MRLSLAILVVVLFLPTKGHANKIDLMAGIFQIKASIGESDDVIIQNLGAYRLVYHYPLLSYLELDIGYSLIASSITGGDLGFGLDLGFTTYVLGKSSPVNADYPLETSLSIEEVWRPYIGVGFHQRQFKSIISSYAGFGVAVGVEHAFWRDVSLKTEARSVFMKGHGNSSVRELTWVAGLSYRM